MAWARPMHEFLWRYGVAFLSVCAAALCRAALIPLVGYGSGTAYYLIAIFVSGRIAGTRAAVFAWILSIVPSVILLTRDPDFDWRSAEALTGMLTYVLLGAIVTYLTKSESDTRAALEKELADRKQIENALRDSRQQLLLAIKAGQLGTWQLDVATQRAHWSGMMESMHGYAPGTFGGTLAEAIAHNHPDDRGQNVEMVEQMPNFGRITYRVNHPNGETRWIEAVGEVVHDLAGRPTHIVGVCSDITERKTVEDIIRTSETRLRAILDNTPAVISLKDLQGRYMVVNRGWERLYGVTNDAIVGRTNDELIVMTASPHMSRAIADQFAEVDRQVLQSGEPVEFEDPVPLGVDGQVFVTVKFPIRDPRGKITGIGGISIDITDRRRAADLLAAEQEQLRHAIGLRDTDRQLIAYEIHDGMVQFVAGALMRLEALQEQLDSPDLKAQVDKIIEILRATLAEGRRLINGIRTPVLDDSGIVAALQDLIDEEDRAHVQVEFVKDDNLGRLAPGVEEALYRITQEALTNVRKHSASKRVRVEIGRASDQVRLAIIDWGVGFNPPRGFHGVHGLRGMTQRAKIAGGHCTISSAPGQGTRIEVELPYLRVVSA